MSPIDYVREHRAEALEHLKALLRIPSVSTDPTHTSDVRRAAEWVAERMRPAGLTAVHIHETGGHPVVYGEWLGAPGAPTVLVYGHYDVQPPDPLDEWVTPPFEPTEHDGYLYARGSADDKGQFLVHLEAIAAWMATEGRLPVNVRLLIEGEEEVGSEHLEQWLRDHATMLEADVAVISDTHMVSVDHPSIVYGLRGLSYLEIEVQGPPGDLHSGSYGGGVINPAIELARILAALLDEEGRITIPGFYDRVRPLSDEERAALAEAPFDEEAFYGATGEAGKWAGEHGFNLVERLGARPTFDVNGLTAGWQGPGAKTVLPARASAKVSMRLVPDQDPDEVAELFEAYVRAIAAPEVQVTVTVLHSAWPAITDRSLPAMAAAMEAYEAAFGKTPVFTREGGSIPVVATFDQLLGLPSILMGFGLPGDALHAPNERFWIDNFYRGIEASIAFMEALSRQTNG